jgi:hypothetical protein
MPTAARVEILEKAYADLIAERDRLRDARAAFTARLGPLPAAAAIVIGLAGSAAGKAHAWWVVEAAVMLALLIFVSTAYSGLPPYRLLRADHQGSFEPRPAPSGEPLAFGLGAPDAGTWLERKINLERELCGPLRRTQTFCLAMHVENLQEAMWRDRPSSSSSFSSPRSSWCWCAVSRCVASRSPCRPAWAAGSRSQRRRVSSLLGAAGGSSAV